MVSFTKRIWGFIWKSERWIAEALGVSEVSDEDSPDETIGPLLINEYQRLIKHDEYGILLGGYFQSLFQNFRNNLRTKVVLAGQEIKLILKHYKLKFIAFEIPRGNYTSGDILDYIDELSEGGIKIVSDDNTMKTMLLEGSSIIRFDDKSFFKTILDFEPYWDYKPHHTYKSEKLLNLNTSDKIH